MLDTLAKELQAESIDINTLLFPWGDLYISCNDEYDPKKVQRTDGFLYYLYLLDMEITKIASVMATYSVVVILGVDPGLAHTGWGIVETRGSVCRARAYGCVETKAQEPIDMRLGRIYDELSRVIQKYEPTALSIEGIYFGQNVRSAIPTAQAGF